MAYAALKSLAITLGQYLQNPDRYSNIRAEKKLVESLHEKLGFLQEFLEDSPDKSNERLACLEKRIRDAAYETEDIIDFQLTNHCPSTRWSSFWINAINCLLPLFAGLRKAVPEFDSYENKMKLEQRILKLENGDLWNMVEEFDSITEEVAKFRYETGSDITEEIDSADANLQPPTVSLRAGGPKLTPNPNDLVVGFSDDSMQIMNHLTEGSLRLEVISVVGMGGIGKTTLVTSVYNNPLIVHHFDVRVWVTVSQSYCTRDIFRRVLERTTNKVYQERDDQLGVRLYKTLSFTRYLIVMDDIWDTRAWDDVKMMFPNNDTRSRIILTTRHAEVAAYASSSGPVHQMSLLDEERSWNLLRTKVFGEQPCPLEFREIGKNIALKCKGLPLSLVVIGGLLSKTNVTQEAWRDIARNVTSFVTSSDQCLEILKLSYNYLPRHLKACFLYMGIFPEDYEISALRLTKLWVAEGFLKQDQRGNLEVVAERCLEELVNRAMVLVSKHNSEGKIKLCRVHDLLRDICVTEANKEKFLHVTEWYVNVFPESSYDHRRLSIQNNHMSDHHFKYTPSIQFHRSLLWIGQHSIPSSAFLEFKLLRVLDAIKVHFHIFPSEILELVNLRYIALRYEGDIPASISKLWNLQTLIICNKNDLFRLVKKKKFDMFMLSDIPVEIWKMQHLRHIEFTNGYFIDPMGAEFDIDENLVNLSCLRTLAGIINLRFTENMLKRIPNVEKLVVSYNASSWEEEECSECHFDNMVSLHHLKTLKFQVYPSISRTSFTSELKLKLAFPRTLKKLILSGCGIPWHDLTIVGSLPNLEVLKLRDHACIGTEWEPKEGDFCALKQLVLEGSNLKHWKTDRENFPCLQRLILRTCYELVEIPRWMGESPTLNVIELLNCKDSALTSAQQILDMQYNLGNDGFTVVVHSNWKDRGSFRFLRPKVEP